MPPIRLLLLAPALLLAGGCGLLRELNPVHGISHLTSSRHDPGDALESVLFARQALLASEEGSEAEAQAILDYNKAAGRFVHEFDQWLDEDRWNEGNPRLTSSRGQQFQLRFPSRESDPRLIDSATLREARLARDIRIQEGTWGPSAASDGLGVPIVLEFKQDPANPQSPFYPPEGLPLPVTVVLDLPPATATADAIQPDSADPAASDSEQEIVVRLHDPLAGSSTRLGERELPLASNLTAPLPSALDPGVFQGLGLSGLFRPARGIEHRALYELQPADPDRVPVVFVHGLNSTPHIWRPAINALLADPVLREQFQPLYFAYPTGVPIPSSAAALRQQFAEWRQACDPSGERIASRHAIFIGHSMGGLLSRMLISDSGDAYWKAFFIVGPDDLHGLSQRSLQEARQSLFFQSTPGIDGVVFMATPHRGSRVAAYGPVRYITRFIQLPGSILRTLQYGLDNPGSVFNPRLDGFRDFGIDGISQLEPEHPFFDALNTPAMEAPVHSVIGAVQETWPLEKTTDRVVPYTSAHLEQAQSETIVPHWHNFTAKPDVVRITTERLRAFAEQLPDA